MSKSRDEIQVIHGLPQPDWDQVDDRINRLAKDQQNAAWNEFIGLWLQQLAVALGEDAAVYLLDDMYLLSSTSEDNGPEMLNWSSKTLQRITNVVGEHRPDEMYGPRVILLFDNHEKYYDYIAPYCPDGEQIASAGTMINSGYYHIVVGPGDTWLRKNFIAHELTHLTVAMLPLPLWLDEGLAQLMQSAITGISHFHMSRELLQRHQAYWTNNGLDRFWTGHAFADPESSELSYHLAEVLTRNIQSSHRKRFIEFVRRAHFSDAGAPAAIEVLDCELSSFVAEFLGPGHWQPPESIEWDGDPKLARLPAGMHPRL